MLYKQAPRVPLTKVHSEDDDNISDPAIFELGKEYQLDTNTSLKLKVVAITQIAGKIQYTLEQEL